MTREEILTTARYAGTVVRYHTWPMHHRQNVGEHSWQCARIYFQIWGPLPPEVSTYFIWHDAGELVTGDIPFPLKKNNPALKQQMDALEEEAVLKMGGVNVVLPEQLAKRVKIVDVIDLWEQGNMEVAMGNQYALPIVKDPWNVLLQLIPKVGSVDDRIAISKYLGMGLL